MAPTLPKIRGKQPNKARNVSGYEKRLQRKAEKQKIASNDFYEYAPEKAKRSNVRLEFDRDEEDGFGNDEDDEMDGKKARLIGDDEQLGSDEDEEIDSDAAFEDEDEDRYAGFFSARNKPAKKSKKAKVLLNMDVDLNEDESEREEVQSAGGSDGSEEEEESGEDDEFINVLDILDGKDNPNALSDDEPDAKAQPPRAGPSRHPVARSPDDNDDEESEDNDEEDNDDVADPMSDIEDDDPTAIVKLNDFISTLPSASSEPSESSKRKLEQSDTGSRPKKRRVLAERTQTGVESEFRVAPSASDKLSLDDLLTPSSSLALSLNKTLNKSKAHTLSAPLAHRAQERLDREAAYEQTKGEVDKWQSTMNRIRDAEHLSFPLQAKPGGRVSNLELSAKFKPTTEMETAVDRLLKAAKLRDEDILATEDAMLQQNAVSPEEIIERRAELRKMRELMYRAEIKARRVAKIKSKTYRKISKKRREKEKALGLDGEEVDEEEASMKRDIERARERATLRHKNKGVRHVEGSRMAVEEELDRQEALRRKIAGRSDGSASDDADDGADSDGEYDPEAIRRKLAALEGSDTETPEIKSKSGVFGMKFMKDAMARRDAAASRAVDDFTRELEDADTETLGTDDLNHGVVVSRVGGRVTYRPGANGVSSTATTIDDVPPSPSVSRFSPPSPPLPIAQPKSLLSSFEPPEDDSTEQANPWLAASSSSTQKAAKKNEVIVSKDSSTIQKSKHKLKKKKTALARTTQEVDDDSQLEISAQSTLKSKNVLSKSTDSNGGAAGDDDSADSEIEAQEAALARKKNKKQKNGPTVFEQRELVAKAFAGDNVIRDFKEAKRQEIEADAPKVVDTTIPGWGSWGGSGLSKSQQNSRKFMKAVPGIQASSRQDYNKRHVIISEKVDKKASKYQVKDLPYPYTSRRQYERSIEQPVGKEWNTMVATQRAVLPKVVVKKGVIIEPLVKM